MIIWDADDYYQRFTLDRKAYIKCCCYGEMAMIWIFVQEGEYDLNIPQMYTIQNKTPPD